jgi:hypothetical protein
MEKRFGEFTCKQCNMIFHDRKKLDGHMGGAHRRNITTKTIPRCKKCNKELIENDNWPEWAIKQRNLICKFCKNIQNRQSYRNKIAKKITLETDENLKKPNTIGLDDIKRKIYNG